MSKRRTIRGVGSDNVSIERKDNGQIWFTSAMGHGYSGTCNWTSALTLAGARRLHTALGELLAGTEKRKARRR